MPLFIRKRPEEQRALTSVPWNHDGASKTAVSQEKALALTPVFGAVRHLADGVSTLPLHGYRQLGERHEKAGLPALFRTLEEDGRLQPWVFTAMSSLVLRGNAVGLVTEVDGFGHPSNVVWVSMERVWVDDGTYPNSQWYIDGRRVSRLDLVHIPWFTVAGRTLGLSPIEAYATTVHGGLSAQDYGNGWFESGGVPPGTFKNSEKKVPQDEADAIKARLVAAIRSRKPIVYGADWDYNPITIPPEQAQFVQTQRLTANQIAAIYGIDPEEIGGEPANSLTYNTEEHRQIKRLANLRPWIERLEHHFAAWMPEQRYVKFNGDAIVRADLKSRWEVHKIQREIGAASIDEIRALEDRPPLPDGKGQDYTPLRGSRQNTDRPSAEGE